MYTLKILFNKPGFILAALVVWLSQGAGASQPGAALSSYLEQNREQQIADLTATVNINSGTLNKEGVRAVGKFFEEPFREMGFTTEWEEMPEEMGRAGHFHAYREGNRGPKILMLGHLDTVFEQDSPFQTFRREGEKAYGPGANDMKDGNLVVLYALKALHAEGYLNESNIHVMLTGDEENVGKPIAKSRASLRRLAKQSDIILSFESTVNETVTIGRRGASGWTLTVTGKRAHSAGILSDETGAGAIYETARVLDAMRRELGGGRELTLSPGMVVGGTRVNYEPATFTGDVYGKLNVVPQKAVITGDLRFLYEEQKQDARATLDAIAAKSLPLTQSKFEYRDMYPAMAPTEGNKLLASLFNNVSQELGLGEMGMLDPTMRGAADIAFAAAYADCLDGLGGDGGGDHSEAEYVDLEAFTVATKRAALFVYRLISGDFIPAQ